MSRIWRQRVIAELQDLVVMKIVVDSITIREHEVALFDIDVEGDTVLGPVGRAYQLFTELLRQAAELVRAIEIVLLFGRLEHRQTLAVP